MGESLHSHSEGSALKNFFTAGDSPADNWTEGTLQMITLVLCCHQLHKLLTCDTCSIAWECSAIWSKWGRLGAQLWCLSLTFNSAGIHFAKENTAGIKAGSLVGQGGIQEKRMGRVGNAMPGVLAWGSGMYHWRMDLEFLFAEWRQLKKGYLLSLHGVEEGG